MLSPVFGRVRGRCLGLGTATDDWRELLASLASDLTAVAAGSDGPSPRVPSASFDTVVAACRTAGFADVARESHRALRPEGTLLFAVDGWPRRVRSADGSLLRTLTALRRRNARHIRRTLRQIGFESVALYGVFPSIADPTFVYPLSDDDAVEWFIDARLNECRTVAARAARSAGMFGAVQPGYLAVCDREAGRSSPESAVTRVSYNRVVTFELDGGSLTRVRKAPRPGAGDATTRNEQRALNGLLGGDANPPAVVTDALPEGSLTASPTGAARIESPVAGVPIADRLEPTPAAVRGVLDVAFDWLASFQRAYRGETVILTPAEMRRRVRRSGPDTDVAPTIDAPITTFVAPSHGDFHPWNVFVDDGGITSVIDWEYATRRGDATVDPAHFLLYLCAEIADDFDAGFTKLCASETPYSTAVRASLDRYCEQVGLSRQSVVAAFPYAHLHAFWTLSRLRNPPAGAELYRTYEPRLDTIAANFEAAIDVLG